MEKGFQNEIFNVLKGGIALNIFRNKIWVLFFVINFALIWVSIKIADFIVALSRLDESKGYMITEVEEFKLFLVFSIPMLVIQVLFLLFVSFYLKKKLYKKSSILLNSVVHFLLFSWFVFNVYQFTINGY